jgi:hypothetical protein
VRRHPVRLGDDRVHYYRRTLLCRAVESTNYSTAMRTLAESKLAFPNAFIHTETSWRELFERNEVKKTQIGTDEELMRSCIRLHGN